MVPFIRDRDVLTIAPIGDRQPRVGEVVAVRLSETGRMAVHRVVARVGVGWLIRGDNCLEADGVVSLDELLGRVVRVERDGRDVRLGHGAEGVWIAGLSRSGSLMRLQILWHVPRQAAASALGRLQGWALYRAIGRRAAFRVSITEAGRADMSAVERRFSPNPPVPPENPGSLALEGFMGLPGSRVAADLRPRASG